MRCFFCRNDISDNYCFLGQWKCPICPTHSGINYSETCTWKADIHVQIGKKFYMWRVSPNNKTAELFHELSHEPTGTIYYIFGSEKILSMDRLPDITVENVIEKTKTFLLFT